MHVGLRRLALAFASVFVVLGAVAAPWLSTGASASGIPVGNYPEGIAIDPANGTVYVADRMGQNLTVINASGAVVATIPLGFDAWSVAVDRPNEMAYVGGMSGNSSLVAAVDVWHKVVVSTAQIGYVDAALMGLNHLNPVALALDSAAHTLYVAAPGPGQALLTPVNVEQPRVLVVGAGSPVGTDPDGVALDLAAQRVYVANAGANTVTAISTLTHKVVATIPVGRMPSGLAVNTATHRVFVTNLLDNTLSIVDGATSTSIATLPVRAKPYGVATDSVWNLAVVASNDDYGTTIVRGTTVEANAPPVGGVAVAIDSVRHRAYIASSSSIQILPSDGTTS